jgi:hypothetical protein
MWKRYFKFVKLRPGRVVTALFGEIDFSSDNIPLERVKELYENDFPYLEVTEEGLIELYGKPEQLPEPTPEAKPRKVKKQIVPS